jgi:hypothetical protein
MEVASPISDDDASEVDQPKKRHWFQLRKPRRHSSGEDARLGDAAAVSDKEKSGTAGRSFVVLRDRKISQPMASGSVSGGGGAASTEPPARSFVVIRGKDNNPSPT